MKNFSLRYAYRVLSAWAHTWNLLIFKSIFSLNRLVVFILIKKEYRLLCEYRVLSAWAHAWNVLISKSIFSLNMLVVFILIKKEYRLLCESLVSEFDCQWNVICSRSLFFLNLVSVLLQYLQTGFSESCKLCVSICLNGVDLVLV